MKDLSKLKMRRRKQFFLDESQNTGNRALQNGVNFNSSKITKYVRNSK